MRTTIVGLLIAACVVALSSQPRETDTLDIYFIDTEGGQATLFVAPSGQSAMIDSGNPGGRDVGRIVSVIRDAGLTQIDYLVSTHYHRDHIGGLQELAAQIPIRHYVDHGPNVEPQEPLPGFDAAYAALRTAAGYTVVTPGDTVPVAGLDWRILTAAGRTLDVPLSGAGRPNPACADFEPREVDRGENAASTGSLITYGRFRMLDLGDLTWNTEFDLMCPENRIGAVDLYLTTHHGLAQSGSEVVVHAVEPRVAIMNNGTRKGGAVEAFEILHASPGLEDLWQLHWSYQAGVEQNAPGAFIANLDAPAAIARVLTETDPGSERGDPAHAPAYLIKVSARADGSFTVTNTRNGFSKTYAASPSAEPAFASRVVATDLESPWEIVWGPDDHLWITERVGRRIVRVAPVDGTTSVAVEVEGVYQAVSQDGLLGLALHPELLTGRGHDYVYVAYTYDADPGDGSMPQAAIRRYTFQPESGTLAAPEEIIRGLPAHDDHVGGRLAYGPDDTLYLSIGDQGGNWSRRNRCTPIRAQMTPTAAQIARNDFSEYQGKILRIATDGSIPVDNPVIDGVRSHVFSYGHRNPQGLAFAADATFYSAEHGPATDDELNIIEAGRNYGWPHVAGHADDQMYAFENWAASAPMPCVDALELEGDLPDSVPVAAETSWSHPDQTEPIQTLFTVPNGFDFEAGGGATIAAGGLDLYAMAGGIPGWADSLLVTSLNRGAIYRVGLTAGGRRVADEPVAEFKTTNRYRDLAIRPDGRAFYIVTDTAGPTRDAAGARTRELANPGAILEFRYLDPE